MEKAGIWIRVSTDSQDAMNQLPEVEQFCNHHGYTIVSRYDVFEGAGNGGKDGGEFRRTLQQALDDARAGKFAP